MNGLLAEISKLNLSGVSLLAFVTDTSYEVVFYAMVNGRLVQSNTLAETGALDPLTLSDFYQSAAMAIRQSAKFKPDSMNVVKVSSTGEVQVSYEAKDCHIYAIRKAWRASLGL